jgi:hypothetical protein
MTATQQHTKTQQVDKITRDTITKLQGISDELTIKRITTKAWLALDKLFPEENSIKRPRTTFRKAISTAFPESQTAKPGYYFTKAGKGSVERYEHLALWYATTNKERWEVSSDEERIEYFANLPSFTQSEQLPEQPVEQQPEPQQIEQSAEQLPEPQIEPQTIDIEKITIESLSLDVETQQIVKEAIAQSGMSLPEFLQQSCKVYAKTITGKTRKHDEDLSNVNTEILRNDKTYGTHPGRANELVKRAVRAIKHHNKLVATELSQKWLITQSLLVDMTGAKATAVRKAMNTISDLEDENTILKNEGATDLLNRKGVIKDAFCNDWVKIIESGID